MLSYRVGYCCVSPIRGDKPNQTWVSRDATHPSMRSTLAPLVRILERFAMNGQHLPSGGVGAVMQARSWLAPMSFLVTGMGVVGLRARDAAPACVFSSARRLPSGISDRPALRGQETSLMRRFRLPRPNLSRGSAVTLRSRTRDIELTDS